MKTFIFVLGAIVFVALTMGLIWSIYQIILSLKVDWSDSRLNFKVPFRDKLTYATEQLSQEINSKIYTLFLWHFGKIYSDETKFHQDWETLDELVRNSGNQMITVTDIEEYFRYNIGEKCRKSRRFEEGLILAIKEDGYLKAFWDSIG